MLLFSGADVMCATGDPVYSTPYLLAKKAGQRLQMEFLYHNKFSGKIYFLFALIFYLYIEQTGRAKFRKRMVLS